MMNVPGLARNGEKRAATPPRRVKNRRVAESLRKSASKMKPTETTSTDLGLPVRPALPQELAVFADRRPATQMSRRLEKRIRAVVSGGVSGRTKCRIVDEMMREVKAEYVAVTHAAAATVKDATRHRAGVAPFKYLGRTEKYQRFVTVRRQFEIRWTLHRRPIRHLLRACADELPRELFAFDGDSGVADLDHLARHWLDENVGKAASQLRDFRIRASTLPDNYSAVCAGLASVHVGDCLQRTMFRIMNFTERTVPYLKLHAYFDAGALVLKPRACDVIDVFWRCLDALMAIGGGGDLYLAPPSVRGRTKGMFLCLTDEFVGSCKTAIAGNVEESFRPVWRYLDDLGAEFADIYADVTSELGPDVSFDDGCRLIERYKRHLQQVARIPDNEYFQIGQLVLSHYRDALRDRLTAIDDDIFRIICAEHLREVNDICDSFELIRTMAKRKPTTTDELIEIGNFMANVKDHQLDELVRRVHASTSSLSKIIVLGSLTERHVALNAGAIKWLEQIPPIIERHTVDFEQLKFEAEEKLQKVIEDVNAMVHEVHPLLVVLDEMDDVRRAKHYLNDITLHMEKIKGIQNQIEWINKEELCLSFPKSSYQEFEHLKGYVYPFYRLIKLCLDVQRRVSVWEHGQFDSLSYETTDATVTKYCRELSDAQKSYRKRLRQAQDENLPIRFKGTVDDPDLLNWPAPLKLCATAVRILDDFKPCLRVMKIMCNPALRARHWRTMSELAGGLDLTPNAGTTLRKLMEIDLRVDIAEYELVSVGATKELELLERLNSLKAQWRSIRFDVVDAEGATILDRLETVEVAIEDHLVGVGAMRCSAFVQAHDEEVLEFQAFLAKTSRAVTRWRVAQRLWLELRPLFTIEDLRRRTDSIHSAKTSFLLADDIIARYMRLISDDPIVRNVVRATDLATDVEECARLLEDASRGVGTFLEEVRLKCPRLYFVSDPELIALLGKRRNANETLPRIFPGVSSVDPVDERTVEVFGVARLERMVVECCAEVGFDELTKTLEERLVSSLKSKTDKCYRVFGKSGVGELVREYPQQVLQVLSRVAWTRDVAAGLGSSRNVRLLLLRKKIAEAIDVKVSLLDASDVSAAEKCSIRNWILTDIDNRNSLDAILAEGMPDGRSFRWLTQMRYTFENSACRITVLKHTLDYGYEYLGDGSLSVTTPTTYKCHLALLNAYFFNYHGAVRGVSGTGKLEIVSGLARALGFLFYRFGCSHATTPRVLMQLAKGGALCGCWLYLARIDSLTQRTLSVISQALVSIVDARRRGRAEVDVGGARVALKSTGFICAATDDVAALRKLPDNLKAAFRTYTVSRPDLRVVAEAMLLSEGFERWQTSASKLANCFSILEDVVPSLRRYSLRTLASIVKRCAEAKHLEPASNELEILRGSIEEALGAGVAPEDRRRFDDVVDGLFPDVVASGRPADVSVACSELGFSAGEVFVDRVRRTLDAVRTAPGVVLVGDAFVGKTSALKVCERLIGTEIGAEINVKVLNPSCFDCSEIFGTDDFLAGRRSTWIVLDELGSAGWVDAVTDCLGSRSVDDRVRFIFEGGDLKDASPSLVSHCRIIYFPPTTIEPLCLINSWINSTKFDWFVDFQQHVSPLLRWFLPACLALTKDSVSIPYGLNPNCLVKSALGLFEMLLEDAFSKTNKKDEDPKNVAAWIHAALLQSGLWSFGGCLNTDDRLKFDDSFKRLCRGHDDSRPYPSTVERLEVTVPHEATLFDYAYVYRQRGAWKLWSDLLKNEKISAPLYDEDDVFAPTVDAVRCGHFLDLHVKYGKRFLIVGPPGTGKSAILRNRFNAESPPADSKALINFGRDLVSARLRHLVLSKLNKTAAGSWAPPASKRLIFFVDDLHMARDPSPIELLRSHFDRNTLKTIRLEGCNFICTSGPPSSARMSRLLSHLDVFCVDESSSDVIVKIYAQTLLYAWKKSGFPSDVVVVAANQIARATLRLYRAASARLTPTPSRCHYAFDLASFSEAVKGCARLKREAYDANKQIYAKVWSGECLRVFGDRLYGPDYDWLRAEMKSVAAECFPDNCDGDDAHPKGIEEAELCAQYNARHKRKLNLVFFDYALKKFAILGRILSVPGANALLLGAAGSGRRTLAKLACFAHAHDYREPTVTTSYDETSWSRELKDALRECGATDRKRAIVASEVHVPTLAFFEIVDYVLRGCQLVDLYDADERQKILEVTRIAAQGGNKNVDVSAERVFGFFNARCKRNFHLLLCLNPAGEYLRKVASVYPSVVTRSNVVYWDRWPDSALLAVAEAWTDHLDLDEDVRRRAAAASVHFHRSLDSVSSKPYVHLVELFSKLTVEEQRRLSSKKKRYDRGLAKLSSASAQIVDMRRALTEYRPQLEEMTRNATRMTEQIASETIEAEKASELVRKDEAVAGKQAAVAQTLKSECEAELAQAIPILEDAISALNTLKPSDITLVKSMKNPPDAIKLVMASVCVIKDVRPDRIPDPSTGRKTFDYWGPSKRILGDMNFLQSLKDFDKDRIRPEIMVKIRKEYLPHKDFKPQVVAKASSAAEGLCKWIIAMDMYDRVAKEVAPKKEKLNKAEKEYGQTVAVLNEKKEEVARIEEKLATLNETLRAANAKQTRLQTEVDACAAKLERAQKLMDRLSGEKEKWTRASSELRRRYDLLPGDLVLSCAAVAYLGSSDADARKRVLDNWHRYVTESGIPCSEDFDMVEVLARDDEAKSWLFGDPFFEQNAVIHKHSRHFCVSLDPQGVAHAWIARTVGANDLTPTKFSHDDWLTKLKRNAVAGKSTLIGGADGTVPPCLYDLIFGHTYTENDETYVEIDGESLKLHKRFRLYVTCDTTEHRLGADLRSRLNVINFGLTRRALLEDLLTVTVSFEEPTATITSDKRNESELRRLGEKILDTVCESEPDILEDRRSIVELDESKELESRAARRRAEAKTIENAVAETRSRYARLAGALADLFHAVDATKHLHRFYRYSLEWFLEKYRGSLLNAGRSKDVERRCENVYAAFVCDVYRGIDRGLFARHKMAFKFWLATRVAISRGLFDEADYRAFVKLLLQLPEELGSDPPIPFKGIIEAAASDPRTVPCQMARFVEDVLGEGYANPSIHTIRDVYVESHPRSPILMISTRGRDALRSTRHLAAAKNMLHKFRSMSMGGDDGAVDALLAAGRSEGFWILLENCHLARRWLDRLDQTWGTRDDEVHENFRLFLSANEDADLPASLIRDSVKIVDDTPDTRKAGLLDAYRDVPVVADDFFYGCPGKQDRFARTLYRICEFHWALRSRQMFEERREMYAFTTPDRTFALEQLRTFVNDDDDALFSKKLTFFIGECQYAGYLESRWDRRFATEMFASCVATGAKQEPWKHDREDHVKHVLGIPDSERYLEPNLKTWARSLMKLNPAPRSRLDEASLSRIVEDVSAVIPEDIVAEEWNFGDAIVRETRLYNRLLNVARSSLDDLRRWLDGRLLGSENVESVAESLAENQVPLAWRRSCYATDVNLPTFLKHLRDGAEFFRTFNARTRPCYNLGAFFYPRAVIADVKLKYSRDTGVEYERVAVECELGAVDDGVVVVGLHLVGARIDPERGALIELPGRYWEMPPVTFRPTAGAEKFECFVFRTATSRGGSGNYVTSVLMRSEEEAGHWVRRGVRCVCDAPR
ncbi:dynein axonemal heavy chain 7-like [Cylas formicarius]|uniref:dynein axonemal heavy chain 7-like n=1 Tax=Cylas formicarius TaxID=197179 RepID=UPI002958D936|nr:dynein axonemal heavy chain 7-like [Cylas formicarius]